MPSMEGSRLSVAQSEDSRESSAEMTNTSIKGISPKEAAILGIEVDTLTKTLSSVSNEAARIVTRQHWRKCLIGTERDQSFLVRAILKHSTPHVYMRAMEDYGAKLLEAASEDILDRALELRLPSINADKLVALLAKAKRLGYDEHDLVDEEDVLPAHNEPTESAKPDSAVLPNPQTPDAVMVDRANPLSEDQNKNAPAAISDNYLYRQPITSSCSQNMNLPTRRKAKDPTSRKFVCPDCTASFAQQGGLTYHMDRKVCHRPAPQFKWFCQRCGKGFTTSGGKLYHEQNKVCESHESANATPPSSNLQPGLVAIKPSPSPQSGDGLPLPGFPSRPRSAHSPLVLPLPPHQAQQNGPAQYNTAQIVARSVLPPISQALPSWPSQRIEPLSQPAGPNYPAFRSSFGSSSPKTPARSSPAFDNTPGDVSSLDAATQAQLNAKIATEVARFEKKCRELPDTLSAADREEAINREKRGHATRKSQIRKKFGIQIRTSKLQQANFVNLPTQGDALVLAPIARIGAFRAPTVMTTPSYSISTPSSIEQNQQRQRPVMEDSEPKRRKLEDPAPVQHEHPESQHRSHSPSVPVSALQNSNNVQSPEILEVDSVRKEAQETLPSPQTSTNKLPKRVQWETLPQSSATTALPPSPPPPSSPPHALRDISNKGHRLPTPTWSSPERKPRSGIRSGSAEAVVDVLAPSEDADNNHDAAAGSSDDDDEDSSVDLDEDIPARLPPGMAPRRTSSRIRGGSATASASASPGPVSSSASKRKKRVGKALFASASATAAVGAERTSRRGSEEIRAVFTGAVGAGVGASALSASRSVVEV